ncbi:MAG: beta-galactosidase [Chloroflexi bacterium]|nr:beta-galactosidase [Chloroflexota bacterium]
MNRTTILLVLALVLAVSCAPTPTATPVPTVPPTATPSPAPTNTSTATFTPVPPTSTSTSTPTITPTSTPTATPTPLLNTFGYGAQLNWTNADHSTEIDELNQLGFTWAKIQVRWCDMEPTKGSADLSQIDELMAAAQTHNIRVLLSVICAPNWSRASGGAGQSAAPDNVQDAADFMGMLAKTYCGKSLGAIEVWNGQNIASGAPHFMSPAVYMDMLTKSQKAISKACPSTVVVSGGLTPIPINNDKVMDDLTYLGEMYKNGLKALPVAIGAYPAGYCNAPDATVGTPNACNGQFNGDRSFFFKERMQQYRQIMVDNGDATKLIWPTTFGWGTDPSPKPGYDYEKFVTPDMQADWLVKAFQEMKAWGWVGVAFVWNLDFTDPSNETSAFHIVGRPAFNALRSMAK